MLDLTQDSTWKRVAGEIAEDPRMRDSWPDRQASFTANVNSESLGELIDAYLGGALLDNGIGPDHEPNDFGRRAIGWINALTPLRIQLEEEGR